MILEALSVALKGSLGSQTSNIINIEVKVYARLEMNPKRKVSLAEL